MPNPEPRKPRSEFSHYLPRLRREFYQGDAVIFWTMPIAHRARGWLTAVFHSAFREMVLHTDAREGLLCPAYRLMPDHLHMVFMGRRYETDQRNGIKFLRGQLGPFLSAYRTSRHDRAHVSESAGQFPPGTRRSF